MPTEQEIKEMKKKAGLGMAPINKSNSLEFEKAKKPKDDVKNWSWTKRFYFVCNELRISLKAKKQGYGYKYCTLQELMNKSYAALAEKGLFITQTPFVIEGKNTIQTEIFDMFNDGKRVLGSSLMFPEEKINYKDFSGDFEKKDNYVTKKGKLNEKTYDNFNQIFGSTITYTRRYALYIVLGILPEEDRDGVYKKKQD